MGNPLAMTSDETLLKAVRSGDRAAFEMLVRKYQNLVTSVAYSGTGDLGRSEDIAQQAFLIAWQKQNDIEDVSRLGGWLCGIVKNLIRNDRRKVGNIRRTQGATLDDVVEPASGVNTPERIAIEKEQQNMLWSVLENLPENYREPLILYYRENQSVEAVSQQMGISNDAVKQRLSRGRAMVRDELQQFVEESLEQTRPSPAFASAVMGLLPVVSMAMGSTAGKTATGLAGSLVGKYLIGGGLMSGAFTGAVLGGIGGVMGAAFGLAGAYYGAKQSIKNATSEEEKEVTIAYTWRLAIATVFMTVMTLASMAFDWNGNAYIPVLVLTAVYSFFVIVASIVHVKRLDEAKRRYGQQDEKVKPCPHPPVSLGALRVNAICAASALWGWFQILMGISGAWIVFAIATTFMIGMAVYLWRSAEGVETVQQQTRFMVGGFNLSAVGISIATLLAWPWFFFAEETWGGWQFLIPAMILVSVFAIGRGVQAAVDSRVN